MKCLSLSRPYHLVGSPNSFLSMGRIWMMIQPSLTSKTNYKGGKRQRLHDSAGCYYMLK